MALAQTVPPGGGKKKRKPPTPKGRATPHPVVAPRVHIPTLQELAAKQAHAALNPETQVVLDAQKAAAAKALKDQETLKGISAATAEYFKGAAPGASTAYDNAAKATAGLSAGLSAEARARLAAGEEAGATDAARLGVADNPSLAAPTSDALYRMGGIVPSASLLAQGAAARTYAEQLPGISSLESEGNMRALLNDQNVEGQKYTDALKEIAAKYPALRDQAEARLQAYESQRAQAIFQRGQQLAALKLQAQRLGLDTKKLDAQIADNNAQLKISQQRANTGDVNARTAQQRANTGERNAATAEKRARDATAGKTHGMTQGQLQTKYTMSLNRLGTFAGESVGKPVTYTGNKGFSLAAGAPGTGKYIAKPGIKGTIPGDPSAGIPRTTNNPRLAQTDSPYRSFAAAMNAAWVLMGGPSLVQMGFKESQIRQDIRRALIAAGWKPDGKRPSTESPRR